MGPVPAFCMGWCQSEALPGRSPRAERSADPGATRFQNGKTWLRWRIRFRTGTCREASGHLQLSASEWSPGPHCVRPGVTASENGKAMRPSTADRLDVWRSTRCPPDSVTRHKPLPRNGKRLPKEPCHPAVRAADYSAAAAIWFPSQIALVSEPWRRSSSRS